MRNAKCVVRNGGRPGTIHIARPIYIFIFILRRYFILMRRHLHYALRTTHYALAQN